MNVCISAVEITLLRMWHPRARVHAALDIQIRAICHLKLWNFWNLNSQWNKRSFQLFIEVKCTCHPTKPRIYSLKFTQTFGAAYSATVQIKKYIDKIILFTIGVFFFKYAPIWILHATKRRVKWLIQKSIESDEKPVSATGAFILWIWVLINPRHIICHWCPHSCPLNAIAHAVFTSNENHVCNDWNY